MGQGSTTYLSPIFFAEDPLVSKNGCEREISTKIEVVAETFEKKKYVLIFFLINQSYTLKIRTGSSV